MTLTRYLEERLIRFDVIPHQETFEAQRMAHTLHIPGRNIAKTVLLKADHGFAYFVAVLPATRRIDLQQVSRTLGGSLVEVATEAEIAERCPECETGALPPFGSRYGLRTLVDESIANNEWMMFESETHREAIRMRFEDFRQLEQPITGRFAVEHQAELEAVDPQEAR